MPNADGVMRFVRRVWPLVRKDCPEATFQVVGRNPTPKVRDLAKEPAVEIAGTVPDVRPYLRNASLVVVPLYVGGGTRLKIFEAMAMRRAVVSTSLGAEGLPLTPNTHCLIADEDQDLAGAVVRVLKDQPLREQLEKNGRHLVEDNYSSLAVARQFDRICRETVEAAGHLSISAVS